MPALPPTMQSVLKTLLVADEPLGRATIIKRADISTASYDRNIDELAALGIVEPTGNGGHRKWQAWLVPWWSSLSEHKQPRTADDERPIARAARWDDVCYGIATELDLDPDYELFAGPADREAVFTTLPALDRWRSVILAHCDVDTDATATLENATHRNTHTGTQDPVAAVEIGSPSDDVAT